MKKLYFLFFLVFGLNASAQIVNIPDANFKGKLLQASPTNGIAQGATGNIKIDTNNDGQIQVSEALTVHQLNVAGYPFANMIGIEEFTNLKRLICFNCSLTGSLNLSQNINLERLDCYVNNLTSLILPQSTSLTELNCYGNDLNNLDVSQNTALIFLNCNGNLLTNIDVTQNIALTQFYCEGNQFTDLDITQNTALLTLTCTSNQITNLNVTQNTALECLFCQYNQLTTIDITQNVALLSLNCSGNLLTNLDVTQNTALTNLQCNNNQLTSLDLTQNTVLTFLDCSYNQLTSLDLTQTALGYFNCSNNQLTSLFIKNGKSNNSYELNFNNNPNLQYICTDEGEFALVQQKINSYGLLNACHANSYCSFTPNGTFYTIQGNSKFDINNNGCEASDIDVSYLKILVTDGAASGNVIANSIGSYYIPVNAGNHTLTPQLENPSYFTVSPESTTVGFPATASPYTQNFCITANGVKNDLEVTVVPINVARPGFDAEYKIIYKNKGNQVANGSLSFAFDDAVVDLVSANPVNDNSATNTLSWNYANLNPFENREIDLVFNINSPMETPAVNGGDVLVYTANIVGTTDETPNDNTFTLNQTVVNSYDPNDKTCLEGATIAPSMVGQYVHYVIRFENTGTYPAENIVVADVIDATKFDIATLVPQRASHDFFTRINGNKVEFIFENINLPFDDANNDGYVAFKIKTKPTLVLGNTFTNSASIYFDYNFPVVTDPATTTVAALNNQDFDFESYFTLYPNPAKDILNFEIKNEIGVKSVSVYNTLGQIVIAITNVDNLKNIDVSSLTAGSYFVKVYTNKGSAVSKFIKE